MADRTGLLTRPGGRTTEESPEAIRWLSNDAIVIRLHNTINHLSRWLTPIHDPVRLSRSLRRGEPSVKDLLIELRDEELRVFPKMHLTSVQTNPDLDKLSAMSPSRSQVDLDRSHTPLSAMADFRRLRQSTCSLLRNLPNDAWQREGISRREHDWTIRALAEALLGHDYAVLHEIDDTLERTGAREGVATIQRVRLPELLKLEPNDPRR